ncbi:hypothetical protein NDA13_005768 [Ustilago tritici]|nr:hypothetical protein NDA13_005768 [Ustilago tritici]
MSLTNRCTKFSFLFLFFALAFVAASAHDPSASAPTLEEAPPGASPPSSASSDGGSISAPAGGFDAKSILADQSHMMGTMSDSTDDNSSGQKPGDKSGPMQHGQCVTSCATKSTDNAGCGKDLRKPDCFCKSQDFIQGTFACVNATCPAQYHGAAGVITSICAVSGAPGLQIPGYAGSDNLENMPTVNNDDAGKKNATTGSDASGATPSTSGGTTPTLVKTDSSQIPQPNSEVKNASVGSNAGGSSGTGTTSGAGAEMVGGAVAMFTAAAIVASVGVWTLF